MIQTNKAMPLVPISRVMFACVLVAALDGAFAVALYVYLLRVCSPAQLMQSIAGALLGRAAFRGGRATVALGLVLHFAVACGWTLVYAVLRVRSARLRQLTARTGGALVAGTLFGVFVWLAMDLLVVPLSRANATPPGSPLFLILLAWHAVGVGIPLALIVREPSGRGSPLAAHA
jgi:hypothetical protein